jgi:hypothetical protein
MARGHDPMSSNPPLVRAEVEDADPSHHDTHGLSMSV